MVWSAVNFVGGSVYSIYSVVCKLAKRVWLVGKVWLTWLVGVSVTRCAK